MNIKKIAILAAILATVSMILNFLAVVGSKTILIFGKEIDIVLLAAAIAGACSVTGYIIAAIREDGKSPSKHEKKINHENTMTADNFLNNIRNHAGQPKNFNKDARNKRFLITDAKVTDVLNRGVSKLNNDIEADLDLRIMGIEKNNKINFYGRYDGGKIFKECRLISLSYSVRELSEELEELESNRSNKEEHEKRLTRLKQKYGDKEFQKNEKYKKEKRELKINGIISKITDDGNIVFLAENLNWKIEFTDIDKAEIRYANDLGYRQGDEVLVKGIYSILEDSEDNRRLSLKCTFMEVQKQETPVQIPLN